MSGRHNVKDDLITSPRTKTTTGKCGWTNAGIKVYNQHFKTIERERNISGDLFDTAVLEVFKERHAKNKKGNDKNNSVACEQEIACNCL